MLSVAWSWIKKSAPITWPRKKYNWNTENNQAVQEQMCGLPHIFQIDLLCPFVISFQSAPQLCTQYLYTTLHVDTQRERCTHKLQKEPCKHCRFSPSLHWGIEQTSISTCQQQAVHEPLSRLEENMRRVWMCQERASAQMSTLRTLEWVS